jgi:hypothetical protein
MTANWPLVGEVWKSLACQRGRVVPYSGGHAFLWRGLQNNVGLPRRGRPKFVQFCRFFCLLTMRCVLSVVLGRICRTCREDAASRYGGKYIIRSLFGLALIGGGGKRRVRDQEIGFERVIFAESLKGKHRQVLLGYAGWNWQGHGS